MQILSITICAAYFPARDAIHAHRPMPVPGLKHLVDDALPEGKTGFVELKKLDAQIKGPQLFVNKVRPRRCTFFLNWQPAFLTFIDYIHGGHELYRTILRRHCGILMFPPIADTSRAVIGVLWENVLVSFAIQGTPRGIRENRKGTI